MTKKRPLADVSATSLCFVPAIMWAFKYPDQLLHRTTENEWFPRSNDHRESRLDALEREEEANQKKMRKIAQAKAKQPIGLSTGKQKAGAASDTPNITSTQVDVSVMLEPPPRPRMWNLSADATSLQSSSSSRAFSPESPVYSTTSYEESDSTSQTLSP